MKSDIFRSPASHRPGVVAAGCYAGYVGLTYLRFGRVLDRTDRNQLMPEYEVCERHNWSVLAVHRGNYSNSTMASDAFARNS
jgi:hypothetical protein